MFEFRRFRRMMDTPFIQCSLSGSLCAERPQWRSCSQACERLLLAGWRQSASVERKVLSTQS